jgi:acyl-CoA synthetase (AMP-forming)/AMP-acid ligase II
MRRDEHGTLWMHTGDEAVMDEDGYLRSAFVSILPGCSAR